MFDATCSTLLVPLLVLCVHVAMPTDYDLISAVQCYPDDTTLWPVCRCNTMRAGVGILLINLHTQNPLTVCGP